MWNLEKAKEKVQKDYPIGSRVSYDGIFQGDRLTGEGTIKDHLWPKYSRLYIWVSAYTDKHGMKEMIVADPENEYFEPSIIKRII